MDESWERLEWEDFLEFVKQIRLVHKGVSLAIRALNTFHTYVLWSLSGFTHNDP